jgi:hypothetical protein
MVQMVHFDMFLTTILINKKDCNYCLAQTKEIHLDSCITLPCRFDDGSEKRISKLFVPLEAASFTPKRKKSGFLPSLCGLLPWCADAIVHRTEGAPHP